MNNNLRGFAGTGDISGTELDAVPGDMDSARERDLGAEWASVFHISLHRNVHRSRRGVDNIL